jgi:predicted ester cyclase
MSTEANKALIRRYLEGIYRGDFSVLEDLISSDYFDGRVHAPPGRTAAERYAEGINFLRRAFPDLEVQVEAIIAEDDLVAFHIILRGTHLGELRGPASAPWSRAIPPTGQPVRFTITGFRRLHDGKLVESFNTWDWLSILRQLGIPTVPEPAPPPTIE